MAYKHNFIRSSYITIYLFIYFRFIPVSSLSPLISIHFISIRLFWLFSISFYFNRAVPLPAAVVSSTFVRLLFCFDLFFCLVFSSILVPLSSVN